MGSGFGANGVTMTNDDDGIMQRLPTVAYPHYHHHDNHNNPTTRTMAASLIRFHGLVPAHSRSKATDFEWLG
jgi:hypothetical protein